MRGQGPVPKGNGGDRRQTAYLGQADRLRGGSSGASVSGNEEGKDKLMSKYYSPQRTMFKKSGEILKLDKRELLIVRHPGILTTATIRVEEGEPNSPDRDKVSVMIWTVFPTGEEPEFVTMLPSGDPKIVPIGLWSQFLTQDGLSSIRPHKSQWPVEADFVLVRENE